MSQPDTPQRYNVLEIISDQHQARLMGCEGDARAITPNFDKLAQQGVRFAKAYTQNPICTPSRVSVLSGQYCHNHGYYGLGGPQPGHHGTNQLPSFMGHFREHGYLTAGIGKLHTPDDPADWLLDQLDDYGECYRTPETYFRYLEDRGLRDQEDSVRLPEAPGQQQHEGRPSNLPYEHSVEGWCVQRAKGFIDRSLDEQKPFCMQVSLPRPHQCYTPDQAFWDMYPDDLALPDDWDALTPERAPHFYRVQKQFHEHGKGLIEPTDRVSVIRRVWRAYLACITQCDHALGELVDYLEEKGLSENTIVVYHSDHGAYSGTFGIPEKAPGICSEQVCRIPMIWRVPGVTPAGHVSKQFVENVDLAPTFTSLCGLPAMQTVDGHDITGLLRGEQTPVRELAVTEAPWSKSIRFGPWRYVHYQKPMFDGQDVGELYQIENDPLERHNLYTDPDHQPIVHEARRLLLDWLIQTTRATTIHPATGKSDWMKHCYATAGDGCDANDHGVMERVRRGQLYYL